MAQEASLYQAFEETFAAAASRVALRLADEGRDVTYGELANSAARFANAIAHLGVAPGDRVTVQVEKSLDNLLLYLAVLKAGAVYQPLNTAYTAAELDYFIGDAKPALVVGRPEDGESLGAIARRHGARFASLGREGKGDLARLAATMPASHATVARTRDDLAGLLYTSGTTGRSKGAMITHGNLESNARALCEAWGFSPSDRLVHVLPIFHVHGLFVALNTTFLTGSSLIWLERFEARRVAELLPGATMLMGVPTFYVRLLALNDFTAETCRTMRLFISGSAPLLAETHRAFEVLTGHCILERYGMTETGMITTNPYDGERLAGTVGYALPGVSVRIADAEGREVPRGEIGVIEVKGPNVFKGYWRMPEKTAAEFRPGGWFITGDLATMAADGRVTIVGRAKDLIISGGFNVYPKEVEDELDQLEGIGESAVIGVPHPDYGEGVIAVATVRGAPPSESDVIAALSQRLARFKVPKRVFFVPALPRNAMGKVQKAELRARFADTFGKDVSRS
jgi:malonyl-CoA/methylmalonyl-CoA synthetase